MATYSATMTATLGADTDWDRFTAANFTPLTGFCTPSATDRFLSVWPTSVTVQAGSLFYGERLGDIAGGDAGYVIIPDTTKPAIAQRFNEAQLALGTQTVTFRNVASSSGLAVGYAGKTRAAVVAEVVALMTALATGIADLEAAAGNEPGLILFQSDAGTAETPTWTQGKGNTRLVARDMIAVSAEALAVGGTYSEKVFNADEDVRGISLRAAVAGAVITLRATITEAAAGPQR